MLINPCLNSFGGCMNYFSDFNLSYCIYCTGSLSTSWKFCFSLPIISSQCHFRRVFSLILSNIVPLSTTLIMLSHHPVVFSSLYLWLSGSTWLWFRLKTLLQNGCDKLMDGNLNHVFLNRGYSWHSNFISCKSHPC